MAKKSKHKGLISNGGRQKAKVHQEEVRQTKFAKKREDGKAYTYKPNPYKKGTKEYMREKKRRYEKNKSSKLPYAIWTSVMRKLNNELAKANMEEKSKLKNKKVSA